jgi:hypothetical protein
MLFLYLQAQQLRLKIQEQDVYELQAFKQLLDDVRGAAMSDEIRLVYEELVAAFPTAVSGRGRFGFAEQAGLLLLPGWVPHQEHC